MKYTLVLFLAIVICSCGVHLPAKDAKDNTTAQGREYLATIRTYPNNFKTANSEAEEAWGRAQVFVTKYSSMKIQTVSNYIIETYNTRTLTSNDAIAGMNCDFAYSFTRAPGKDSTQFTVSARSNYGLKDVNDCLRDNEHFASYYVKTGNEIQFPEFIQK